MKICHLTPAEEFAIPVTRAISLAADMSRLSISQSIVMFGTNSQQTMISGLPVNILQQDKDGMTAENSTSQFLWKTLKEVDIVHIYRLFSNFGLYCTCVAKSLGKTVIGFDYWRSYHPIMTNSGLELIDAYHAIDPMTQKMIAAIYSGPVLQQKIEHNMDGAALIKFYLDLHANSHH